jgi:hypothetical protein
MERSEQNPRTNDNADSHASQGSASTDGCGDTDSCRSTHGTGPADAVPRRSARSGLSLLVDLRLPAGEGDKRILRLAAARLGLNHGAGAPKKAIQFGSAIARQSNVWHYGSNRKANKQRAGGVVFEPE